MDIHVRELHELFTAASIISATMDTLEQIARYDVVHAAIASMFVAAVEEMEYAQATSFLHNTALMLSTIGVDAHFKLATKGGCTHE